VFGYVQIVKIINHDQTSPLPDEEQPPEPERSTTQGGSAPAKWPPPSRHAR
jgi:hypothetical protein